jgi:hypothetical protein
MAEQEWKRVTHEEGLPRFSATPSIDMRPAGAGVDIVVRYVTRAGVRLEKRNRLFGTVVGLMLGRGRRREERDGSRSHPAVDDRCKVITSMKSGERWKHGSIPPI